MEDLESQIKFQAYRYQFLLKTLFMVADSVIVILLLFLFLLVDIMLSGIREEISTSRKFAKQIKEQKSGESSRSLKFEKLNGI